jgi:hypothetical protein
VRFVEITIPAGKREAVLDTLDDEGIDYAVTEETSNREFTDIVSFPLPPEAVEPVLDRLHEAGLHDDAFTIIFDAETVISRRFEALQDRYAEDETEERISREELRARVKGFVPALESYIILVVASVAIATAGVFGGLKVIGHILVSRNHGIEGWASPNTESKRIRRSPSGKRPS